MIHEQRINRLNWNLDVQVDRPYVVYWMQASQRVVDNHALAYAIDMANSLHKPLIVYFGLTDEFPEANWRHYAFMLEGLQEVKSELHKQGIQLIVMHCSPEAGAILISELAALMVTDRGYLRVQRQWRLMLAEKATCPVWQVESDVMVPIEEVSLKEEYAAATIRGKINSKLMQYVVPLQPRECVVPSVDLQLPWLGLDLSNLNAVLEKLAIDRTVKPVPGFHGGTSEALVRLEEFVSKRLSQYSTLKNEPSLDYSSNVSPYLHFGQISPLTILLRLQVVESSAKHDFIEELVVRRELSMNFVYYNEHYDSYLCLSDWAKTTLQRHISDEREYVYSLEELESAQSHDPYWNAAQEEMVWTGKMHGYMRMYWGKKVLQWSKSPEEAFSTAIYLNNKYSLDGRNPNAFTGVAWCFGKHDRPWTERSIFGMVRYMNDKGLKRKFDMDAYLAKVARIKGEITEMASLQDGAEEAVEKAIVQLSMFD